MTAPDALALAADADMRCPAVVTVRGWTVVVGDPVGELTDLATLDRFATEVGWRHPTVQAPGPGSPPFAGGAVGWLCDDLAPELLHLPAGASRPAAAPVAPVWFGVYDSAVCFPPDGGEPVVTAADVAASREPAADRRTRWRRRLDRLTAAPWPAGRGSAWPAGRAAPSLDRQTHRRAVRRAQEWIAAGDLYQLNLTLQLAVRHQGGGADLARALWAESPGAAHAAWLSDGNVDVVSVSPETFLRTAGGNVTIRPIKGTRPRSNDAELDGRAAEALRRSTKDAAEHIMIVDLERNDLGRVCLPGTVRVPAVATLEAHPTVWHLTSTVEGMLRADVTLRELVAATFPCGSVTGAPKRAAWDRIRELEPVRRGVYCGAMGIVTRGGIDLSVAIRTAVLHDGIASYGTGGGIVADSDADAEWEEAMDKAAAFLRATGAERPP